MGAAQAVVLERLLVVLVAGWPRVPAKVHQPALTAARTLLLALQDKPASFQPFLASVGGALEHCCEIFFRENVCYNMWCILNAI